jgi:N-methylhydantoinase B
MTQTLQTKEPLPIFADAEEPDPVTFEVLRHRLWAINEEHGTTLLRMSGSPVAVYAQDFNPGILTAEGEWVYFGPYVQFINSGSDAAVKWIMEHRALNPGIRPGDIFITNDPWVGTIHQQDVVLAAPVFIGDELLCWVTNTLHMYDLGGITPGSYCPAAKDVYDEATMFPPLKIQEGGELRADIVEAWLRQSRMPHLMTLDLNGMVAGCRIAQKRILENCGRYGAAVIKGTMERVIADSEKVFVERLRQIPDGIWRERSYIEVASTGDHGVYVNSLRVRKEGSELYFSNEGSSEQIGSINCTSNAWRGSIVAAINPAFLYDQLFAIGGALRHCHFEVEPRRINSAEHPVAVSNTSPCLALNTIAVANNCIGRMLVSGGVTKDRVIVSSPLSTFAVDAYSGVSQWGEPFGTNPQDQFLGGIGAFSFKDGIDNGGTPWGPKGTSPNMEHNEQSWPILYLWRNTLPDSGGAGRFRGGDSSSAAVVPHRIDEIRHDITAWGMAVPTSTGLFGGLPASPNRIECIRGSNVRSLFASGRIPRGLHELEGDVIILGQRVEGWIQGADDIWITSWCGGAGYGDPLGRDPELVAADLAAGVISAELATRIYGVVLRTAHDGSVTVDAQETVSERESRRKTFQPNQPRGS